MLLTIVMGEWILASTFLLAAQILDVRRIRRETQASFDRMYDRYVLGINL